MTQCGPDLLTLMLQVQFFKNHSYISSLCSDIGKEEVINGSRI